MATLSPATSGADVSDDAAPVLPREPEPAPDVHAAAAPTTASKRKGRPKRDPAEQRAQYLAKRREIKARARSRKKETASSLSEQYALLQKQLGRALAAYKATTRERLRARLSEANGERLAQLWDAYVDALGLDDAITRENQLLVDRIDEFLLVECRLLLPDFNMENEEKAEAKMALEQLERDKREALLHSDGADTSRRGYWTHFCEESHAPFYYEYYSEAACNAVIARNYEQMQRDIHEASTRHYGNIDAADRAVVRFQFRKTLVRASSADLMDEMTRETSRIFHSPALYGRLYGMRTESQVLQRVGAHTSVILQSMSDEHRAFNLRSFMLFSFVEERLPPTPASRGKPRRAMTILNVVVPPREEDVVMPFDDPRQLMLYLTDCVIYMRLEQVNDTDLEVIYGGHAHCLSPDLARVCVLESVSSFFRWVQQVIPERLVTMS